MSDNIRNSKYRHPRYYVIGLGRLQATLAMQYNISCGTVAL